MRAVTSQRSMASGPLALFPCIVSVTVHGVAPSRHHYEGLFRSTTDAVLDAMERFPNLRRVSAKVGGKLR